VEGAEHPVVAVDHVMPAAGHEAPGPA
jgi:hypothetical protein